MLTRTVAGVRDDSLIAILSVSPLFPPLPFPASLVLHRLYIISGSLWPSLLPYPCSSPSSLLLSFALLLSLVGILVCSAIYVIRGCLVPPIYASICKCHCGEELTAFSHPSTFFFVLFFAKKSPFPIFIAATALPVRVFLTVLYISP